jgi:hypothetical protein
VLCITNKSTPDVQGEINEANISISGQSLIATLYSSQECKDGSWSRDVQKTKSTFRLDYYYFTWKRIVKANDMTELRSFSMGLRQETVMKSLRNWAVLLRGFIL